MSSGNIASGIITLYGANWCLDIII
jgi:hypothetical protein